MCGRFAFSTINYESLMALFNLDAVPDLKPRYNIAPSQIVPIIRKKTDSGTNEMILAKWGFVPHWAKGEKIAYKLINARSETVAEKLAFKSSFRHRRCLVPATGFYEWKQSEKKKQPYFVSMKTGNVFAMAGLWDEWENSAGDRIKSFTILTTVANVIVKEIHERMPVIATGGMVELWLDSTSPQEQLKKLLTPYSPSEMTLFQVSDMVNNPRNDTESCSKKSN